MVNLNATLPFLSPVSSTIDQVFGIISLLVGGIFGIYLITLLVKIVFFRKVYKSVDEVKISMKRMEGKIDKLLKEKK